MIRPVGFPDIAAWAGLRHALWDFETADQLAEQGEEALAKGPDDFIAFIAWDGAEPAAFAEASVRRDYVNGCETQPVAFLEGIYVAPAHRGRGLARALIAQVEAWARALGLTELGSDALLDNTASHAMHGAVGFEETERVVYFRKPLQHP